MQDSLHGRLVRPSCGELRVVAFYVVYARFCVYVGLGVFCGRWKQKLHAQEHADIHSCIHACLPVLIGPGGV
jgi:hypothetical protein